MKYACTSDPLYNWHFGTMNFFCLLYKDVIYIRYVIGTLHVPVNGSVRYTREHPLSERIYDIHACIVYAGFFFSSHC